MMSNDGDMMMMRMVMMMMMMMMMMMTVVAGWNEVELLKVFIIIIYDIWIKIILFCDDYFEKISWCFCTIHNYMDSIDDNDEEVADDDDGDSGSSDGLIESSRVCGRLHHHCYTDLHCTIFNHTHHHHYNHQHHHYNHYNHYHHHHQNHHDN